MRDSDLSLESLLKLLRPGMPKVVPDQRLKFAEDPLFARLQRDNAIAYSPYRDRSINERRCLMLQELQEGFITVAICSLGLTLRLLLDSTPCQPKPNGARLVTSQEVRLDSTGQVHFQSRFILNGVCVIWTGVIDSISLCGSGRVLFDNERADAERQALKEQLLAYHSRIASAGAAATAAAAGAETGQLIPLPPGHPQPLQQQLKSTPMFRRKSSAFEPFHRGD